MADLSSEQLRESFLEFFESRGHLRMPSFSLVPADDPTLLIVNAGMAPLKPYFKGEAEPPRGRVTTCQKCVRVGDIEEVGKTRRHHTFFEMLGNFSFGDYYKKEAIKWAWDYFVDVLKLPAEKLYVTIHTDDDEAEKLWIEEVGFPPEKIYRLDDNFWGPVGNTGPCGPCSELLIDQGPEFSCGKSDCKPGCDCDRYLELWNLVFTGLNKKEDGSFEKLPAPCIDTGLGFERLVAYMSGKDSAYKTELFSGVIDGITRITGKHLGVDSKTDVFIRIIADHIRSVVFMVSDGITPSNEGRGYVLRRLIRRAVRVAREIGFGENSLVQLIDPVIEKFGKIYPELVERRDFAHSIVSAEEENFKSTLNQGISILDNLLTELEKKGKKVLPGKDMFHLYDTYGFPHELTREIASERGFEVDENGFLRALEEQRQRARSDTMSKIYSLTHQLDLSGYKSEFTGYSSLEEKTRVLGIFVDGQRVDVARAEQKADLVFGKTPFYGESGGQVGDTGVLSSENSTGRVVNTVSTPSGVNLHQAIIDTGKLKVGDFVKISVDRDRREAIKRHHTATHLLQAALREVFGSHVGQMGSLVDEKRLRFDFSHHQALTTGEIEKIEELVNREILNNRKVVFEEVPLDTALDKGALAFFGEKYGERVRVVSVEDFSMELCGGTHVNRTGDIGCFKITSESAIGMGIRRLEAVAGMPSVKLFQKQERILKDTSSILGTDIDGLKEAAARLKETQKNQEKEIKSLKLKLLEASVDSYVQNSKEVQDIRVVSRKVEDVDREDLRKLADMIAGKIESGVVVLGTEIDQKAALVVRLTPDLIDRGLSAVTIIRQIASIVGGGGGGKDRLAQAGGKNPEKLEEALLKAEDEIGKQILNVRVAK